jgi:hypothetical protein
VFVAPSLRARGERSPLTSQDIVGLLATPARLRVVAAVVLGAGTPGEVVAATGLSEAQVSSALARLARGGLVVTAEGRLAADVDAFAAAARNGAPKRAPVDYGVSDPKVAAVLRAFLVDGRLTSIPGAGRKRSAILEYLVATFEPGRRYSEREVNAVLAGFHPDTAALRRYLVDEEFLSREAGLYWRTGGWVDDQ